MIVEAFIAVLKVAEILLPMDTPVAPKAGAVDVTVGTVGSYRNGDAGCRRRSRC